MLADSDTVFPDNTVLSQPPSPAADGNADDCDVDAEDDALLSPRSRARALISRDNTAASSNPNVPLPMHIGEEADFNSLLELFYARLFPFREFYRWLCYGQIQKNYFQLRELSFTLSNDAYLRFQSFKDGEDLKRRILELKPVKIDIGAVYNVKPSDKKHVAVFNPLERELVFDIDMTDYDPVRSCCTGADICLKCWDFMTLSIKILDRALQDDFGFKHRLWVYSGRRGVHCWVCDDRARKLSPDARRAIVNYLEIVKGGEEHAKRVSLNAKAMHPSLRKAVEILTPVFTQRIIENQDVLTSPEKWTKVLSMIPDDESKKILSERWSSKTVSPKNKWEELLGITQSLSKKKPAAAIVPTEIIFQYSYPRLDSNVSVGLNHLLKAPFCVHPKTGRVCVPIDPKNCDSFNPFNVPTLTNLINEISSFDSAHKNLARSVADFQKTSLKESVEYFRQFVESLEAEAKEIFRARRDEDDRNLQF